MDKQFFEIVIYFYDGLSIWFSLQADSGKKDAAILSASQETLDSSWFIRALVNNTLIIQYTLWPRKGSVKGNFKRKHK